MSAVAYARSRSVRFRTLAKVHPCLLADTFHEHVNVVLARRTCRHSVVVKPSDLLKERVPGDGIAEKQHAQRARDLSPRWSNKRKYSGKEQGMLDHRPYIVARTRNYSTLSSCRNRTF